MLHKNYIIPKIKRELKLVSVKQIACDNYTIPKIKRELKPRNKNGVTY